MTSSYVLTIISESFHLMRDPCSAPTSLLYNNKRLIRKICNNIESLTGYCIITELHIIPVLYTWPSPSQPSSITWSPPHSPWTLPASIYLAIWQLLPMSDVKHGQGSHNTSYLYYTPVRHLVNQPEPLLCCQYLIITWQMQKKYQEQTKNFSRFWYCSVSNPKKTCLKPSPYPEQN